MAVGSRQEKIERAIDATLGSFGLGSSMSYHDYTKFRDRLIKAVTPTHDIATAADMLAKPQPTVFHRLHLAIARMVEETALDVREDRSHIDPAFRANIIVDHFREEFEALLEAEKPSGTKTQALMAKGRRNHARRC